MKKTERVHADRQISFYFGDFAVIPIAVLLFAGFAFADRGLEAAPAWALSLIVGIVVWTLVEYLIHRFVYHGAPVLTALHDAHHREPLAFVGVPSFLSSGLVIAICYLPLRLIEPIVASGFTSGMLIGYAGYMFVHHATHHFSIQPGDWLYEARVRHMAHHYHDDANFGVSVGVLGSRVSHARRAARPDGEGLKRGAPIPCRLRPLETRRPGEVARPPKVSTRREFRGEGSVRPAATALGAQGVVRFLYATGRLRTIRRSPRRRTRAAPQLPPARFLV